MVGANRPLVNFPTKRLRFQFFHIKRDGAIRRYASVKLTDAGRRYLQSEHSENYIMKAYEIGMGEVTGIQIDGSATRAVVEYSLVVLNATPFAENVPASPMRRRASFSLYDDGWRMQE